LIGAFLAAAKDKIVNGGKDEGTCGRQFLS
jgi:hypothetical protein